MFIIYDKSFNLNELYVITLLILGIITIWKLRKAFTPRELLVYCLFSITIGLSLDHIISMEPFEFYDVNDSSAYQFIDFLTYLMYGPMGGVYIYLYNRLRIENKYAPIYVLIWTLISIIFEFVADACGVYHYRNGYSIYYSFPIYLIVFSIFICMHKAIKRTARPS